jgi:NAD+ synthase (glutamine-hydrolysing)
MPSRYNSDLTKNAAFALSKNLGTRYAVIPIEDSVTLTTKQMEEAGFPLTEFKLQNIQARDRSSRILAAVAASFDAVFTCNANKSEAMVGYTTLYGDLGGFFAPLGDLWKTQVYELARYVNTIRDNPIPKETLDVVPSAELSATQDVTKGKGDPIQYFYHDKLFASWIERWDRATPEEGLQWYLDGTLAKEIGYDEVNNPPINKLFPTAKDFIADIEKWWNLYDGFAIAKRIQAPPILSLSRRSLGYDHRETQEQPYYSEKYKEMKRKLGL